MEEVANRRGIVDRRKLQAAAEALIDAGPGDPVKLRAALTPLFKQAIAEGRQEVRRRLLAGATGRETVAAGSWLIDQVFRVLYDVVTARILPPPKPKADQRGVVAVGGYGRGELAP